MLRKFYFFIFFFNWVVWQIHQGQAAPVNLQVKNREIIVNGKKAEVFEIIQPNGTRGLFLQKGDSFDVVLENHIHSPTGVHWHGLILPNDQDGVPFVTQSPIPPGEKYRYHFPLIQAGTFWMHAHYGLQEQKLLAAPLILYEPSDKSLNQQEVVMFLSDFTFRNPLKIFEELKKGEKMDHDHSSGKMMKMADLNDVEYDAFLANWRTLVDPEVIKVVPEKEIRLRVINGSSSTNFFIQLGQLKGEVIATDGSDTLPLIDSQFELGVAQRLDIRIKIPSGHGVYPILAQGEGLKMRTGLVLVTQSISSIPVIKEAAEQPMKALSYHQEFLYKAKRSLPKKDVNRRLVVNLDGDMKKYIWTINGRAWPNHEPLMVKQGERVELLFVNYSSMSHPMHLHGHVFQLTEIDGKALEGALRDTILVLPKSTVKVQFDADHPGHWALHCHNLYHQYGGMMTTLNYIGFKGPTFATSEVEH